MVAGTDTFGTALDPVGKEVRLLAEASLPKLDALRAATTRAASHIGRQHRVGRLARGIDADVLVVDGNPLDDAAAMERIQLVIAQGAVARTT